jgi:hypothetical protein
MLENDRVFFLAKMKSISKDKREERKLGTIVESPNNTETR